MVDGIRDNSQNIRFSETKTPINTNTPKRSQQTKKKEPLFDFSQNQNTVKNDSEVSNTIFSGKNTHTVAKGEGIGKIVSDALKAQGLENPTEEQIKAAKEAFLEANKDLVKTYNGVKKEWHGNKFFYTDDVVKLPDFNTLLKPPAAEKPQTAVETKAKSQNPKVSEEQKAEIQQILGDEYIVEYAQDGSLVVKDKSGKILPEMTKTANDTSSDEEDIEQMLSADKNGNKELEFAEFSNFINDMLTKVGVSISEKNQPKFQALLSESFNSLDTGKNGTVDKTELAAKAKEVIQKLTDDIGNLE